MKRNIVGSLILFLFLHIAYIYPEGFLPNTLVKTSSDHSHIEQLKPKDNIISCCIYHE